MDGTLRQVDALCDGPKCTYISLRSDRSVVVGKQRGGIFPLIKIKSHGETVPYHVPMSFFFCVSSVSVYCNVTSCFILKAFPFACQTAPSSLVLFLPPPCLISLPSPDCVHLFLMNVCVVFSLRPCFVLCQFILLV